MGTPGEPRRYSEPSMLPIIGTVAAGDPYTPHLKIAPTSDEFVRNHEGTFALRVIGDSMAPVALDGQVLICDGVHPVAGDLVVCCLQARGAVFRRFAVLTQADTITLEAVNPGARQLDGGRADGGRVDPSGDRREVHCGLRGNERGKT